MLHSQFQLVTAKSMAVAIASAPVAINLYFGYSVQCVYTTSGTLGGVLALQASNSYEQDPQGNVVNTGTWTTLASPAAVTLSAAGNTIFNVADSNYSYFRLIYTPAMSDSGTLNAYATIKGI